MSEIKKVTPRKKSIPTSRDLEQALATMKALGYKVEPPSTSAMREKQESSIEKLGFTNAKSKKSKVVQEKLKYLTATLGTTHILSGQVYGPGEISIPKSEVNLFNQLIHQDRLSYQINMDSKATNPYSRYFLIRPGTSGDQHNKFSKIEVSEATFNSEKAFEEAIAVTAGKFDAAGYNPSFDANSRGF